MAGNPNDITGAQVGAPDMPDWMSNLVGRLPFIGGAVQWLANPSHDVSNPVKALGTALVSGGTQTLAQSTSMMGSVLSMASNADPTRLETAPVLAGLHDLGIGSQGDQWDGGVLRMFSAGMDKLGSLATFGALLANPGLGSESVAQTWERAFNQGPEQVNFGQAMDALGQGIAHPTQKSILLDPDGVQRLQTQMNGTWGANAAAGVATFAMYSAVDPTRGLSKVTAAARAANYVEDATQAGKNATLLNEKLLPDGTAPGTDITPSTGAKVANTLRTLTPGVDQNDATVVGHQWASKAPVDGETDMNKVLNYLDPMQGMGGQVPRSALPSVAEMYVDAARIAHGDTTLERQIKLNVDYALTGDETSMNWLAKNVPMIAAKGARVASAPSEFTLLEDALNDYAAKSNIVGMGGAVDASRAATGDFNLGDWVSRHYSDPRQQAELNDYGEALQNVQRFRAQVWGGGPDGGPVEFGTSGLGLQVGQRSLEKLKTAINNKVVDEHLYQGGPTGLTIRVLSGLSTPAVAGYISVADPVLGNKQLMSTLAQFNGKVGGVDDGYIAQVSHHYLALDPAARSSYIRQVNDDLLSRVAAANDMAPEDVNELVREDGKAYIDGRQYASAQAKAAAAAGNPNTALGNMGGAPTVLNTKHLQSHLDETVGLYDWQTADQIVKDWKSAHSGGPQPRAQQIASGSADVALKALAGYHQMWKHAQLGRAGLVARVLMDTDLRANAMIGGSALMMHALLGAANIARNFKSQMVGDVYDMGVSTMNRVLADQAGMTADELRASMESDFNAIRTRQSQADRAEELSQSLAAKQRNAQGQFHALTGYYKQKAAEAKALADRLRGDTYAFGTDGNPRMTMTGDGLEYQPVPVGKAALVEARAAKVQGQYDAANAMDQAAAHYEGGVSKKFSNANNATVHTAHGISLPFSLTQDDMQWASLPDEIRGSGGTLSQLLLGSMDKGLYQDRVDFAHMKDDIRPTDPKWPEKFALAVQQLRESHTARRMLVEGDAITRQTPVQVLNSFLRDPAVVNEFRQSMGGGQREDLVRWLSDIATSVKSMAPSDALKARLLQEKPLLPDEVRSLVPQQDRFQIYGPNLYRGTQGRFSKFMEGFYKVAVDIPDVYAARIPVANELYHRNIDQMLPNVAAKARAEGRDTLTDQEALELHSRAKQRALNDTRRDMYDLQRQVGVHASMRYIAPFFNPWYDVMQSWARLIYDDPSRFGALQRYANTADMFGVAVNGNNIPTKPWDGTPLQDKAILVPLFGLGGMTNFRLALGSTNTITQGNTPFSPGMGPLAQLAGTAVVADVMPRVFPQGWKWMAANPNNIISQSLFPRPGDVPKGGWKDIAETQIPSYIRSFSDAFAGENGFGNVYLDAFGTRYNDLIVQYRTEHGGANPTGAALANLQSQAEAGARAAAVTKGVISFGLGLSGNASPEGQYYVDKMHSLVALSPQLKKLGLTPELVFAANYPTAANLNWSYSVNNGNLEASVNATTAYMTHSDLMQKNPDIQWWIAGPDNIMASLDPNNQFSQSAYNQQLTLALRRKYSEADLVKQDNIAMAQGKMDQFNNALNLYMRTNGITSIHSTNAGSLSDLKTQYENQLRAQYPDWATHLDQMDSPTGKRSREINQIESILAHPPADLASRPDVQLTRQYLLARQSVVAQAQAQGISNWQTSSAMVDQRAQLFNYGLSLANSDVVFQQAWSRLFEGEFKSDIQKAQQQSLAAGQAASSG